MFGIRRVCYEDSQAGTGVADTVSSVPVLLWKFVKGARVFQNLWESNTMFSCEICGLFDSSTLGGGEQEEN
jgi:hypothetical protein